MHPLALITGGGSGIGRALAHALARRGHDVLIVGRRAAALEETREAAPERILTCAADVATASGRETVAACVLPGRTLAALVHNAALVEPVVPLEQIDLEAWRYHQAVNVEGPLFLTQRLLPALEAYPEGGRVLHLSSGAAHKPYAGWGAYCSSKAALHMLYRVLREELAARNVVVGSARPGVVDTPMQDRLREADASDFPSRSRFVALKQEGRLSTPETAARFLSWLLLDVDAERFAAQEWDARDDEHHAHWR